MKTMKWGLGVALVLAATYQAPRAEVGARVREVVRPDAIVHKISQAEWSVKWWQWAASFDYQTSPVADRTGERCAAGQEGPVWFLAGVYGSAPVKRHCVVPTGKYLFFPIINYMVAANPEGASSCEDVTATARRLTDSAYDLTLLVDGVPVAGLSAFRQVSPDCFNLGMRVGRDISPTAANGYFVMLKPLQPGRHTLKWGGRLESVSQGVIYELEVVDEKSMSQPRQATDRL